VIVIEPTKKDFLYERRLFLNGLLAILGQARIGGTDSMTVSEPLSDLDRFVLQQRIRWLSIRDGAEDSILDGGTRFRGLRAVSLRASNNSPHLIQLAANYPDVGIICISQAAELSNEAVVSLRSFKRLQGLEVWCPLKTPSLLLECIPRSLNCLQVDGIIPLPRLPKLAELRLNNCQMDSSFLENLDAPHLTLIDLNRVHLLPGSLRSLIRFPSLRELCLLNSHMDDNEIDYVRQMPYLGASVQQTGMVEYFLNKAEGFFAAGDFRNAVDHYKAAVFPRPTAKGYMLMARCYLNLGNIRQAVESCNYAESCQPDSTELATLRAEILTRLPHPI
jgi:hypothetical protein